MGERAVDREEFKMQEYQDAIVALGIIYRTDIDPMRASTYLGCEVRDRPRLTSFYQASMSLQRQRCVALHRRRFHLCRRSLWNQ